MWRPNLYRKIIRGLLASLCAWLGVFATTLHAQSNTIDMVVEDLSVAVRSDPASARVDAQDLLADATTPEHLRDDLLHVLALSYAMEGDMVGARREFQRMKRAAQRLGDGEKVVCATINIGNTHNVQRDYIQAIGHYDTAISEAIDGGYTTCRYAAIANYSSALLELGMPQQVIGLQTRLAAAHNDVLADQYHSDGALINLAAAHIDLDDVDAALSIYEELLEPTRLAAMQQHLKPSLYANLVNAYLLKEDFTRGEVALEQCFEAASGKSDDNVEPFCRLNDLRLSLLTGRGDVGAKTQALEAAMAEGELGLATRVDALELLAVADVRARRLGDAETHITALSDTFEELETARRAVFDTLQPMQVGTMVQDIRIELLNRESELAELRIEQQRTRLWWMGSLVSLVMVAIVIGGVLMVKLQHSNLRLAGALDERRRLDDELKHRVKNSYMLIISLLRRQQSQSAPASDREYAKSLSDIRGQIESMALVQSKMVETSASTRVDISEMVPQLVHQLMAIAGDRVEVHYALHAQGMVDPDVARPLALILNELVSNAIEHAMPSTGAPEINLGLSPHATGYRLTFADNGPGFDTSQVRDEQKHMGLALIHDLVAQIGGSADCRSSDAGTVWTIDFPHDRT